MNEMYARDDSARRVEPSDQLQEADGNDHRRLPSRVTSSGDHCPSRRSESGAPFGTRPLAVSDGIPASLFAVRVRDSHAEIPVTEPPSQYPAGVSRIEV